VPIFSWKGQNSRPLDVKNLKILLHVQHTHLLTGSDCKLGINVVRPNVGGTRFLWLECWLLTRPKSLLTHYQWHFIKITSQNPVVDWCYWQAHCYHPSHTAYLLFGCVQTTNSKLLYEANGWKSNVQRHDYESDDITITSSTAKPSHNFVKPQPSPVNKNLGGERNEIRFWLTYAMTIHWQRWRQRSLTARTWSSIVLWSVSCSHVPSMMESSVWHSDRRSEVVVLAGLSVSVNSATSSRSSELNAPAQLTTIAAIMTTWRLLKSLPYLHGRQLLSALHWGHIILAHVPPRCTTVGYWNLLVVLMNHVRDMGFLPLLHMLLRIFIIVRCRVTSK